jgi:cell wall-associated NlpC family hydrolase
MLPGGGPRVRRRLTPFVATLLAGIVLMAAPSPALAGGSITAGEEGSGIPAIPVVLPDGAPTAARLAIRFADLEGYAWARPAISYVAASFDWMRDFAPDEEGLYPFKPGASERRRLFARALVRAFAPDAVADPSIAFPDVDPETQWHTYAAIAVERGWMRTVQGGAFEPNEPLTMRAAHRALVFALRLRPAAGSLDRLRTVDGTRFAVPPGFGTTLLGMRLGLRYNAPSGSESLDVGPDDVLSRAQAAYSLYRAATQPAWNVDALLEQYTDIRLPHLGPRMTDVVQWGVRYVGYPYVWGGEWGLDSQAPGGLGGQPRSGFDCSGMTWWLLRQNDDAAWKVAPPRPYAGWSLAQRTSADMARMTPNRIRFGDLKPGDIMFYDGDGDGTVDHVDTFIGGGWALDSSSTPGGVTIMWVGDGWYRDHFVHGRRILP